MWLALVRRVVRSICRVQCVVHPVDFPSFCLLMAYLTSSHEMRASIPSAIRVLIGVSLESVSSISLTLLSDVFALMRLS